MNFKRPYNLAFAAMIIAVAAVLISSCKENISTIGSPYLQDSVFRGTNSFSDSADLRFTSVLMRTVSAEGISYNINSSSPYLFFGNSSSNEALSAWFVLKMPLIPDSTGTILDDTLVLSMSNAFYYGPSPVSELVEFDVYTCDHTTDSTASLSMSDLSAAPVGHYSGTVYKDSTKQILMRLDTAKIIAGLKTASMSLVIVPTANMHAIRAFASNDNGSSLLSPYLKLSVNGSAGQYFTNRYPLYDYHIVTETGSVPNGTFGLRGSTMLRERIVINTNQIRTQLGLSPFVTINSALLEFSSNPDLHTAGITPVDTILPTLLYRDSTSADSIASIASYGSRSTADANMLQYQVRVDIEYAIRHGLDSITFDLVSGYASRSFGGTYVIVDDYSLDRWVFHGQNDADPTKRPKLLMTYSYLK